MKLTASTRVAAPADTVRDTFADPCDLLDGVKMIALTPKGPEVWDMAVEMGGRRESGELRLVGIEGGTVRHEATSAGLLVEIAGRSVALSEAETDLVVDVEMKAQTMKAKMMLPMLAMAQGKIEEGLGKALSKLARKLEGEAGA